MGRPSSVTFQMAAKTGPAEPCAQPPAPLSYPDCQRACPAGGAERAW